MSNHDKDADKQNQAEEPSRSSGEKMYGNNNTSGLASSQRTIHHINPLGMRVLVRILKENDITEGGLYLPEGAKDSMAESIIGEVIEVASAIDDHTDEETNVSGIPMGAKVLIPKKVGTRVPWDDQLRIVDTKDVLATVEKISLS